MKIKAEKVWQWSEQCWKILGWEGVLNWKQVPEEYSKDFPNVVLNGWVPGYPENSGYLLIDYRSGFPVYPEIQVHRGDVYSDARFQEILAKIRAAGERLHQINLKRKWSGTEVFTIGEGSHLIKLTTEKVWEGSVKSRKLVDFSGVLNHSQVPREYQEGFPRIVAYIPCGDRYEGMLDVLTTNQIIYGLRKGESTPEETFQQALSAMRQAANRLREIDKKAKWSGVEEFTI